MCRCFVKYFLFSINLLFTIIGLILIGLGVTAIYKLNDLLDQEIVAEIQIEFLPYIIIIFGVIVFSIAFSGCCGAITETKILLITYAVFMLVLAAVKIYTTVTLSTNLNSYTNEVESYFNEVFEDPQYNVTIHGLEALLECCGPNGTIYYKDKLPVIGNQQILPPTCCKDPANVVYCYADDAFQKGCTDVIGEFFVAIVNAIGIALIVLIVYEVVVTIFSIYIIKTIKPKFA